MSSDRDFQELATVVKEARIKFPKWHARTC